MTAASAVKLTKEQWTEEVYKLLCAALVPVGPDQEKNLRGYAEAMSDCECDYFAEGLTPKEAVDEEFSCS